MKNIVIIGATGSIGINALNVVREFPDEFKVSALVARSNVEVIEAQVNEFAPDAVCLSDCGAAEQLKEKIGNKCKVLSGEEGISKAAAWNDADLVLAASSGSTSLMPVLDAINAGKDIAIANKEIVVMAGRIITETARKRGVKVLPVDSEHNAVFQCLEGSRSEDLKAIILTGSGGPLRTVSKDKFKGIPKDTVIRHPKWTMGRKISVDSATMMNKGLEMIEAKWLFGLDHDQVKILVHPEAVVHSMVEFVDGSILAQMGPTDMKAPILHALAYPKRLSTNNRSISLSDIGKLSFEEPDRGKFPCLDIAHHVFEKSDSTLGAVLNAADEVAVHAFLNDRIDFADIPGIIKITIEKHSPVDFPTIEDILRSDKWAREEAERLCSERGFKDYAVKRGY